MEPRTAPTPSAGNRHDGGRRGGGGEQRFQLFCGLWLLFGASVVNVATLHQYAKMRETPSSEPRSKVGRWLKESVRLYRSRRLVPSMPADYAWWLGRMDPLLDHPYKGARHPNGTTHLLVDPSPSRLAKVNITQGASSATICPPSARGGVGIEGEGGHRVLEKVRGGMLEATEPKKQGDDGNKPQRSRILCMVYSVYFPLNQNGTNGKLAEHANLRAVAETWGQKCDGFIGASNYTDHSIGAVDLLHSGPEDYGNMWQKVRSMWAYATNYIKDYDYFHIIGDDGYVVVDNLRLFLDSAYVTRLNDGYMDEISRHGEFIKGAQNWTNTRPRPLLFGSPVYRRQRGKHANGTLDGTMGHMTYPNGGSGYTLNRAALQLLQKSGLDYTYKDLVDWREDVFMGALFSGLGLYVSVTADDEHGGRYLESAQDHADPLKWQDHRKRMRRAFGILMDDGLAGVSKGTISFHLKDDNERLSRAKKTMADLLRRYHAVLYNSCAYKNY